MRLGNSRPCGPSPVLDHLYSTEAMAIERGAMGEGRHGKVVWLARERPELLPFLKVCINENRPDNCGRCRKCVWTTVCLEAVGALEAASGFPPRINVDFVRGLRFPPMNNGIWWRAAADVLAASGRSPEVERAIRHALRRTARPSLVERTRSRDVRSRGREPAHDPDVCRSPILFYRNQTNAALSVLRG